MSEVRYGLIGAGMMGQEHMRNIALLEGARVTALADPCEAMRNAATELAEDVRAFADHTEMLSADLCDAYVVAAPNDLHFALMRDVLGAGKPVLCEKPLAIRTADCEELARLAERSGTPVWVAMEYRYMPPVARLLDEAQLGRAGRITMMAIREHRFPFLQKVDDWNRFNARTGGTLVEKCCHFFDLMRLALAADPVRIYASGGSDVNHKDETIGGRTPDILDNAFVVVDFSGGARAMLDLCMFAEGSHWQEVISLTGELARLDAFVPGPARFSKDGKERAAEFAVSDRRERQERREVIEVDETILRAGDHHGSTFFQHQRFLEMVRSGGTRPEVTLADGTWAVRMGEAAERSARTGEAVRFAESSESRAA